MKKENIDKIVHNIKEYKLKPVWEMSFYNNEEDDCPQYVYEYPTPSRSMIDNLANAIIYKDFGKIELAIIGQDKDGYNETCYIIKTINFED